MSDETIDLAEDLDRNNFFSLMIVEALTAYWGDRKGFPFTHKLVISFTVNGHAIPLRPAFEHIERQFNKLVESKAKDLLKEKFFFITNKLERIYEVVEDEFPDWDEK